MLTLIRNGEVFGPEPLGKKDILLAGSSVEAVAAPGGIRLDGVAAEVVDAAGLSVLPGLVDPHVHILGGGGEGGPATRAPEIRIEDSWPHIIPRNPPGTGRAHALNNIAHRSIGIIIFTYLYIYNQPPRFEFTSVIHMCIYGYKSTI